MVDAISSYSLGNLFATGSSDVDSSIKTLLSSSSSSGSSSSVSDVDVMYRAATRQSQALLAGMQATAATSGFNMRGEDGGFGNLVTMMQKATDWIEQAQSEELSDAERRSLEQKFSQLMSDFKKIAENSALTDPALLEGINLSALNEVNLGSVEAAENAQAVMMELATVSGNNFDNLDSSAMTDLEKAQQYLTEALTGASSLGITGYNATGSMSSTTASQLLQNGAALNLLT